MKPLVTDPPRPGPRVAGADGTEIATWDLGGSGPPALLVHATGFHAWTWIPLAAGLGGTHRVWAVDLRGHGTSGHPPGRTYRDWSLFASDLLAAVDALALEGSVGVGHSLGGASLLLAEQARPGTFSSLYCYEPIVIPPGTTIQAGNNSLAVLARKRRGSFPSAQAAVDNFRSKPPFAAFAPGVVEAYVAHGFAAGPHGVSLRLPGAEEATVYEGAPLHDAYQHLGDLDLPVTIAGGDRGPSSGPGTAVDALAALVTGGRSVRFPTLSHFGPMEDPPLVAASVLAASVLAATGDAAGRSTDPVPPPR